jgi:outer membrane protein assembly factor BamE (lipoprotein component of BamABCDE complex)
MCQITGYFRLFASKHYARRKMYLTASRRSFTLVVGMKLNSNLLLAGVLGLGFVLSGCSTFSGAESRENVKQLSPGMSENRVLSLLGTPDSVEKVNERTDRWIYEFKKESKRGHNLYVDFKNGSFIHSGELSGRDVAAVKEDENTDSGSCTKWKNPEFVEQSLCTH